MKTPLEEYSTAELEAELFRRKESPTSEEDREVVSKVTDKAQRLADEIAELEKMMNEDFVIKKPENQSFISEFKKNISSFFK